MVRKLRRSGQRIHMIDRPVWSSARRWERDGFYWNTLRNLVILFAFLCGVSAATLYRVYYGRDPPTVKEPAAGASSDPLKRGAEKSLEVKKES